MHVLLWNLPLGKESSSWIPFRVYPFLSAGSACIHVGLWVMATRRLWGIHVPITPAIFFVARPAEAHSTSLSGQIQSRKPRPLDRISALMKLNFRVLGDFSIFFQSLFVRVNFVEIYNLEAFTKSFSKLWDKQVKIKLGLRICFVLGDTNFALVETWWRRSVTRSPLTTRTWHY